MAADQGSLVELPELNDPIIDVVRVLTVDGAADQLLMSELAGSAIDQFTDVANQGVADDDASNDAFDDVSDDERRNLDSNSSPLVLPSRRRRSPLMTGNDDDLARWSWLPRGDFRQATAGPPRCTRFSEG